MILLKMSYKSRKDLPLDDIYDEIMDHMKSSGDYDILRVKLKDPIERGNEYRNIIERFKIECERFCETVDLNQNRQALRTKLGIRFESYSRSRSELITLIRRSLEERNEEIRSSYYEKARTFLKRFLPEPTPPPEDVTNEIQRLDSETALAIQQELEADMDMDIDSSPEQPEKGQLMADQSMEDQEDPPRPPFSPIGVDGSLESCTNKDTNIKFGDNQETQQPTIEPSTIVTKTSCDSKTILILSDMNSASSSQHKEQTMTGPSLDEIPIPPDDEVSLDSIPIPREEDDDDKTKKKDSTTIPEDISQKSEDEDDAFDNFNELEQLTFSSVSSIMTADLSDFDNSIKLSDLDDDEANVVGKPKNSKVRIEEVEEINHTITRKLNDLQANVECKNELNEHSEPNELTEPTEASESDGGCSESTAAGRRIARTRKSNPRYSNEHYKLYRV